MSYRKNFDENGLHLVLNLVWLKQEVKNSNFGRFLGYFEGDLAKATLFVEGL